MTIPMSISEIIAGLESVQREQHFKDFSLPTTTCDDVEKVCALTIALAKHVEALQPDQRTYVPGP